MGLTLSDCEIAVKAMTSECLSAAAQLGNRMRAILSREEGRERGAEGNEGSELETGLKGVV